MPSLSGAMLHELNKSALDCLAQVVAHVHGGSGGGKGGEGGDGAGGGAVGGPPLPNQQTGSNPRFHTLSSVKRMVWFLGSHAVHKKSSQLPPW